MNRLSLALRKSWLPLCLALVAAAFICFRAVFFLKHGYSLFDSDQAVYAIMGVDWIEGRTLPTTFYGQKYLFAIEAYLSAPFLWLFGYNIAAFKAHMFVLNFVCFGLFYSLCRTQLNLSPNRSLLLSFPLALPPAVFGLRMMAIEGGNLESMIYVLLFWCLRKRPWRMGLLAGLACFQRLFSIYGLAAILVLAFVERDSLKRYFAYSAKVVFSTFLSWTLAYQACKLSASFFGPKAPVNKTFELPRYADNLKFLFTEMLPPILGFRSEPLESFGYWGKSLTVSENFPIVSLTGFFLLLGGYCLWGIGQLDKRQNKFPEFLILTGLAAMAAYVLAVPMQVKSHSRYLMMVLWIPMGICLRLALSKRQALSAFVGIWIFVWCLGASLSYAKMWGEYETHAPRDRYADLIKLLDKKGITRAKAIYWDAYYATFVSGMRILVTPTDHVRVLWLDAEVNQAQDVALISRSGECEGEKVLHWTVCPQGRASSEPSLVSTATSH